MAAVNKIKYLYLLIVILLTACGANATPTPATNTFYPTVVFYSTLSVVPVTPTLIASPTSTTSKADQLRAPSSDLVVALAPDVTMVFVRVPAGEFLMGSTDADKDASDDEKPQSKIYLDEFWIGKYDVTEAQYAVYAHAANQRSLYSPEKANHPIVLVTWYESVAFTKWLSQVTGKRITLPTEAQWEKAARGTAGRIYPWGNEAPDNTRANFNNNVGSTTEVGKYSPAGDSPYGVADMEGNVIQWTSSLWGKSYGRPSFGYPYNADDGRENPDSTQDRILRGSYYLTPAPYVRIANRDDVMPKYSSDDTSFRVVMLGK